MPRTNASYVRSIRVMIKRRQHLKLFSLLVEISMIEGKQRYKISRKLALYYPVIAEMVHDASKLEDCEQIVRRGCLMVDGKPIGDLYGFLLWLNNEFLCATGCNCGGEESWFFEEHTFYEHVGHKWFREWVYKHLSKERKEELLPSLEYWRTVEEKCKRKLII